MYVKKVLYCQLEQIAKKTNIQVLIHNKRNNILNLSLVIAELIDEPMPHNRNTHLIYFDHLALEHLDFQVYETRTLKSPTFMAYKPSIHVVESVCQ